MKQAKTPSSDRNTPAKKHAITALKRSEERLSLALEASSMGVWEWDIGTDELYWSPTLKKMFGLKVKDDITYEKYISLIHPKDLASSKKHVQASMKTGEAYKFEHRVIYPDGNVHWILGKGQAFLENGKPVRMVGTCINIDDQKHFEAVLKRQNTYLNILHTTAVEASLDLGQDNPILETVLKQAMEITKTSHGYIYLLLTDSSKLVVQVATGVFKAYMGREVTRQEGIAGTVWKTSMPVNVANYDAWKNRLTDIPKGVLRAAVGIPIKSKGDIIGVMALGHDKPAGRFNDEQKQALEQLADLASIILNNTRLFEELQESEARFRSMADSTPVMVWLSDTSGALIYLNKSWLEFTGRDERKSYAKGWAEAVHPDDHDQALQQYNESVKKHEPFSMEYRLRRHDGQFRWVLDQGVPRFSADGTFQGFIGSCMDIHDVKRANELALANSQLKTQRTQLMTLNKAKDDFIALASHQLRTPATAVKQYVSLLIDEFAGPLTPDQLQYLQIAYNSNERQLRIINDLLKTAQIDSSRYILDKQPQDITTLLQAAIEELEVAFDMKGQTVSFVPNPNLMVNVDPNEMHLVFVNLLENASKYSYPNTDIRITTEQHKNILEITIHDRGVGIDKRDAQRIFDKFTRVDNDLSDTVSGTGLGLYWVKRIILMHGGAIRVRSKVGEGSSFTVRLPL